MPTSIDNVVIKVDVQGSAQIKTTTDNINNLESSAKKTEQTMNNLGNTAKQAGANVGAAGGNIRNVAFQVQDLAVQIAGGTSAFVAFGQQLPQLLGGFGVMGAVIGALAAVSIPLFRVGLQAAGVDMRDLSEKLSDFGKAAEEFSRAQERNATSVRTLQFAYGDLAPVIQGINELQRETSLFKANVEQYKSLLELKKVYGEIYNDVEKYVAEANKSYTALGLTNKVVKDLGFFSEQISASGLIRMNLMMGLTNEQAYELGKRLKDLDANAPEKNLEIVKGIRDYLRDSSDNVGTFAKLLTNVVEPLTTLLEKSGLLGKKTDAEVASLTNASTLAIQNQYQTQIEVAKRSGQVIKAIELEKEMRIAEIKLKFSEDDKIRSKERSELLIRAEQEASSKIADELNKRRQDRARFNLDLDQQTESYYEQLRLQKQRIREETELIYKGGQLTNISQDQLEVEKAKLNIINGQYSLISRLQNQSEKIELDQQLGLIAPEVAKARIEAITRAMVRISDRTALAEKEIVPYVEAQQSARKLEEDRKRTIDNLNKSIDDYITRTKTLGDSLRNINNQQRDISFQGSLIGKGQLEKDIANIKETARKGALEAGRAYSQAFEDTGDGLTPERARELALGLDRISQGYKQIADSQIENLIASRDWNAGWSEAFANYADSAKNAADQAKTYFETFTRGFENLFVDLITKGKANWRDFVTSIIAEFARIEARRMLLNLTTGGDSGKGLLGGIVGSLFPGNFGSPAQQLAAGLIPMAAGGYVTRPTAALIGEAGPEAVIPLNKMDQMGGTQVTYNINAVDAASFRSLIARDPAFIHAVAETGRRSQPTRRG